MFIKSQEVADVFAAYLHELMRLYPYMGLLQTAETKT